MLRVRIRSLFPSLHFDFSSVRCKVLNAVAASASAVGLVGCAALAGVRPAQIVHSIARMDFQHSDRVCQVAGMYKLLHDQLCPQRPQGAGCPACPVIGTGRRRQDLAKVQNPVFLGAKVTAGEPHGSRRGLENGLGKRYVRRSWCRRAAAFAEVGFYVFLREQRQADVQIHAMLAT